jgi:hypothetical protein
LNRVIRTLGLFHSNGLRCRRFAARTMSCSRAYALTARPDA